MSVQASSLVKETDMEFFISDALDVLRLEELLEGGWDGLALASLNRLCLLLFKIRVRV